MAEDSDGSMVSPPNCRSVLEPFVCLDTANIHHLPPVSSSDGSPQNLLEASAKLSLNSAEQLCPLVLPKQQSRKTRKRLPPNLFGILKNSEVYKKQPNFKDDYADDFEITAEAIAKRLLQLSDCIEEGLNVPMEHLEQILLQLRKKRILISVLGRHNTGKSTFLNALLANELLPMNAQNETSVRVKIKHENDVHRFPCPEQENDPEATCKACPYIVEEGENFSEVSQGTHKITSALKKINSNARVSGKKVTTDYEVHGYVSCISEAVTPPNWSVLLVDNPGFGEGNQEEIMKDARASLVISSAYVYIMSYTHLEDANDTAAMKHIYQKDKDVFMKNRLLVVVTNFDQYYKVDCFDEEEEPITSDDVKRKVKQCVKRATEGACDIPDENVVPICGQWALFAKELYHQPENKKLQVLVYKCLVGYGGPTTKGPDMAIKLEEASGIRAVEERIKEMVHSSFEAWVESTSNAFDGFLKQARQKLDDAAQTLEEFANDEEEDYKLSEEQLIDLDKRRQGFSDSLSGERSEVYKKLSEVYPNDTKKPIDEGKKMVREKMDAFKNICTACCADNYQPQQFEKDVDAFLEETYCDIQSALNSTYSFNSMNSSLQNLMVQQSENFTTLKAAATEFLCEMMETTSTEELETESSKEESIEYIMKQSPTTLVELRKKVEIPPLSKKWFRRLTAFWNFVTRKHQGAGLRPEELDKPLNVLKEELENVCSQHFDMIKPQIMMFFYGVYHQRATMFLRAFDREFKTRILSRKKELTEEKKVIDGYREEVQTLRQWSAHLNKVGRHLFRKADECLKQLSTKERTLKLTKQASQSNVTACAVKEDANTLETKSEETALYMKQEGDEVSSTIEMNSSPELAVITEGQSIKHHFKSHRPRTGAIVRKTHMQGHAKTSSAGASIDVPKLGRHPFTPGQPFLEENSHLICDMTVLQKSAKEDPKGDGAAVQLLERKSLQSSASEQIGMLAGFETDFQEDLVTTCEIVKARLEELQREQDLVQVVSPELIHEWKQAEEHQVYIAVFGKYNSGKSLLLNALVGKRYLPVSRTKHTMVKVKLQHDKSLHHPKETPDHPESEPCEKCPILMKGSSELCSGIKNISDTLRLTNESLQTGTFQEDEDSIIHANIPLLSCVPEPWQVHLVDNPGFMELTEVEVERQLTKLMAPSAYIYAISYNELKETHIGPGVAFKSILDKDQAKVALLENQLAVAVTHFDCYYNALNQEGMLDAEQVKEVVCTSIETATSRTFPRESVIPICSHWAIVARQLIHQQQVEKYEQRAFNCFHYCADERIHNLLTGDESSHAIAQKLETVSGIKQLETRIIQMSQRAYVKSVLTTTRKLSLHLVAVVTKLRSYIGRAGEVVQDYTHKLRSATVYRDRIANKKAETARLVSGMESSTHQDLQSHCEEDIQGLLKTLQSKSKELQELFKQDCAAKISVNVAFGPPELEEGLNQLVQDTYKAMMIIWNGMEFESTRMCFDLKIKEVNEKYEQMRQDAYKLCTGEVTEHKTAVCRSVDHDAILNALKKILHLQELKIKVELPSTGGVFRKEKSYSRLEQLQKAFNQFEKFMNENLLTYIDSVTPRLIELLYSHFCDHVTKLQEAFDEEFSNRMQAREVEIEELIKVKEKFEDEIKWLNAWSGHLEKLRKHLEAQAEEILT